MAALPGGGVPSDRPGQRRPPPTSVREHPIARELRVEFVRRDRLGSITTLITAEGAVDAATAAEEITTGRRVYVAGPDSWVRADVKAVTGLGGAFVFANWDGSGRNNLHDISAARTTPMQAITVQRAGLWARMRERVRRSSLGG